MSPTLLHFLVSLGEYVLSGIRFIAEMADMLLTKPPAIDKSGIVLVTGAGRGLGREVATLLANSGFSVVAGVLTDTEGKQLLAEVAPVEHYVVLNVTDRASIEKARVQVEETCASSGKQLVALINNAGVIAAQPVELASDHTFEKVFDVNLKGTVRVTQSFLPLLRASRGRIVNISSVSAVVPFPIVGIYEASKAALEQISRALRMELADYGIEVIHVRPGAMQTDMSQKEVLVRETPWEGVSADASSLYKGLIKKFFGMRSPGGYVQAKEVAENAVLHAVTSDRPLPVYHFGYDSAMGYLMSRVLPERTLCKVMLRSMENQK